ncbi:MAG TPA: hypothetical protein VMZ28_04565 [Kofleriaceae bacterium]|nr:hypothetical protein [Kofleriaceae bacterium]
MTRRRPAVQYNSLTSLLDVLFLIVFAALIHSTALEQKRAAAAETAATPEPAPEPEPAPPGPPVDADRLHRAALDLAIAGLEGRAPVIARIGTDGRLRELEVRGAGGVPEVRPLGLALVEAVPDPDIALIYLGDRSADLRLCNLVRLQLGTADLANHLVIVAPDAPVASLSVALALGLRRDADRCLADQRGVAILVDKEALR